MQCPTCRGAMWSVEYRGTPDDYDGTSEYACKRSGCGVRIGRWSGEVLAVGQWEPRHGISKILHKGE